MQGLASLWPLLAIFVVFYFMLIRPQKKQQQQYEGMLKELTVGDYIITRGGIKGVITKVKDQEIKLRIATGVEIELIKSGILQKDPKHEEEEEEKEKEASN